MNNFVSISALFFRNFLLIYNDFVKINLYSYKFIFIRVHKIRVLCLSITVVIGFVL